MHGHSPLSTPISSDLMCYRFDKQDKQSKQITISSHSYPIVEIEIKIDQTETFLRYREQLDNVLKERKLEVTFNMSILINEKYMTGVIEELIDIKLEHDTKVNLNVPQTIKRQFNKLVE